MSTTFVTDTLVHEQCVNCGVSFGMPRQLQGQRRADGKMFYCPNGHGMWYGKSEATRLREELENERRAHAGTKGSLEFWKDEEQRKGRQIIALRGHTTRLKKRIGAGRCPCCHETFPALSAHIATEHPGYTTEPTP